MSGLDAIDRNIIRLLRLNARISNAKLAEAVGLSPSACLRRVNILEQTGIIRGYTALVGTGAEEGIAVIVQITLDRQTEEYLNRFEAAVRKYPEIRECFLMTGGSDYFLRVEVDGAANFERVHK
ncbi:MAG TPA: Lrp/AsnC family transcriptional regulator, partial [Kaistia sp.]|nr:Lrp/AsnC family transcriptional regulator [Kaistia sp.]